MAESIIIFTQILSIWERKLLMFQETAKQAAGIQMKSFILCFLPVQNKRVHQQIHQIPIRMLRKKTRRQKQKTQQIIQEREPSRRVQKQMIPSGKQKIWKQKKMRKLPIPMILIKQELWKRTVTVQKKIQRLPVHQKLHWQMVLTQQINFHLRVALVRQRSPVRTLL